MQFRTSLMREGLSTAIEASVARMERSEIRDLIRRIAFPDCAEPVIGRRFAPTRWLCAEHDRQLGGESLLSSLIVAKD
jgi:hypothetical protein